MLTFMTFGAGFLMRPLGAVFLGAYVDRIGRRQGLILTLGIMAFGTILIAFVPSYQTIGLVAPFLVLVGRLLQGFSAGVELGGVSVYLAEMATPGNKGFYVSWQSGSQQVAVMVAALIGYALNHLVTPQQMQDWGWRIPFFIGCAIVPFLFYIRRSLEETKEFLEKKHRPTTSEVFRTLGANFGIVLLGMMLVVMTTVSFYAITVYTPTFGKSVLKLSETDSLIVTFCVALSNLFWLPVMGAVSDRYGRRGVLAIFSGLTLLTAYPVLHWLVGNASFGNMLIALLWLSFLYGSYNGAMVVALTEIVPRDVRTAGFSLAYSLATALFGGFTPLVSTWLIEQTGTAPRPAGGWPSVASAGSRRRSQSTGSACAPVSRNAPNRKSRRRSSAARRIVGLAERSSAARSGSGRSSGGGAARGRQILPGRGQRARILRRLTRLFRAAARLLRLRLPAGIGEHVGVRRRIDIRALRGRRDDLGPAFAVREPHVVDGMLHAVETGTRGEHPAREDALETALLADFVHLDEAVRQRRLLRRARDADARRDLQAIRTAPSRPSRPRTR